MKFFNLFGIITFAMTKAEIIDLVTNDTKASISTNILAAILCGLNSPYPIVSLVCTAKLNPSKRSPYIDSPL